MYTTLCSSSERVLIDILFIARLQKLWQRLPKMTKYARMQRQHKFCWLSIRRAQVSAQIRIALFAPVRDDAPGTMRSVNCEQLRSSYLFGIRRMKWDFSDAPSSSSPLFIRLNAASTVLFHRTTHFDSSLFGSVVYCLGVVDVLKVLNSSRLLFDSSVTRHFGMWRVNENCDCPRKIRAVWRRKLNFL